MKALTVWQPWASLIALGHKPYEFRGWPAPARLVGQRIAIHAGARPVKRAEVVDLILRLNGQEAWTTGLRPSALDWLDRTPHAAMWCSAVVATVTLGKPVRANRISAELGGPVNDSTRYEHANWAWPMLEVEAMQPPIEATGAQGFWEWQ